MLLFTKNVAYPRPRVEECDVHLFVTKNVTTLIHELRKITYSYSQSNNMTFPGPRIKKCDVHLFMTKGCNVPDSRVNNKCDVSSFMS